MEKANFTDHISRKFNTELENLRNNVLSMGGMVEGQLQRAIDALTEGDSELGLAVAHDDYKVNHMEVSIDEECSRILALRSPAASDLRLIVAIIKTITDLERMGDEAEKIGFLASRLASQQRPSNHYREIKHLSKLVLQMLRRALDSFARLDAEMAIEVVKEDAQVDEEYESIQRQSITFMMEDPRAIRRVMDVMWTARALERIGDHAQNICEHVVYMVLGKDVRHTELQHIVQEMEKK
ncbi:MAG: phosphate signaling complex protein PhoU [Gammaproteobacteria bacterium]